MRYRSRFGLVLLASVACVGGAATLCARQFKNHMNTEGCAHNLQMIGRAIGVYAANHDGAYPDSLAALLVSGEVPPAALVCPGSSDTVATGATTRAVISNLTQPGHSSYAYVGRGLTNGTLTPKTVIAFEPVESHGNGMNVLFGDGHVEFVDAMSAAALETAARSSAATRP